MTKVVAVMNIAVLNKETLVFRNSPRPSVIRMMLRKEMLDI